jgi:hypothetical protein
MKEKNETDFNNNNKSTCKNCLKIRSRERYHNNPTAHCAEVKKWRDANKDKYAKYQKNYREKDPAAYAAYHRLRQAIIQLIKLEKKIEETWEIIENKGYKKNA